MIARELPIDFLARTLLGVLSAKSGGNSCKVCVLNRYVLGRLPITWHPDIAREAVNISLDDLVQTLVQSLEKHHSINRLETTLKLCTFGLLKELEAVFFPDIVVRLVKSIKDINVAIQILEMMSRNIENFMIFGNVRDDLRLRMYAHILSIGGKHEQALKLCCIEQSELHSIYVLLSQYKLDEYEGPKSLVMPYIQRLLNSPEDESKKMLESVKHIMRSLEPCIKVNEENGTIEVAMPLHPWSEIMLEGKKTPNMQKYIAT